ncbi:MAG: hypothetical protein ACTSWC_05370 [Promethearchaeota archaeon]
MIHINRKKSSGGIGLAGSLTIIFIILKLTGVISWSWLWVLSPLWISAALIFLFLLFVGIILLSAAIGIINESSKPVRKFKKYFEK